MTLEIDLKDKMHVYAPEVKGYIPIGWNMQPPDGILVYEAEYGDSEKLHLEAIDETVPVYHGSFQVIRDIRADGARVFVDALKDLEKIEIQGEFKYQACDDKRCYFPATVPLKWTFPLVGHDLTRVPEPLRRAPPGD